jgi:periplasmic divalent cation tolerance protein
VDDKAIGCSQVQSTAGSREEADRVAAALLEHRLAACVQVVGPVESRYWWEGRLETATEWLCLVKTTDDRVDEVVAVIQDVHSYDVPEIIALPVVAGSEAYLRWIGEVVTGQR